MIGRQTRHISLSFATGKGEGDVRVRGKETCSTKSPVPHAAPCSSSPPQQVSICARFVCAQRSICGEPACPLVETVGHKMGTESPPTRTFFGMLSDEKAGFGEKISRSIGGTTQSDCASIYLVFDKPRSFATPSNRNSTFVSHRPRGGACQIRWYFRQGKEGKT
jgi:hypothetical protein